MCVCVGVCTAARLHVLTTQRPCSPEVPRDTRDKLRDRIGTKRGEDAAGVNRVADTLTHGTVLAAQRRQLLLVGVVVLGGRGHQQQSPLGQEAERRRR